MRKILIVLLLLVPASVFASFVDCSKLPTLDQFLKSESDKTAAKKVQSCLQASGFYNGPINGVKGSLTVAALKRASTQQNKKTLKK